MRLNTIGYEIAQGFKNIWRNLMFSLASVATMTACIFLFGLFFAVLMNFNRVVQNAEENVGITVFFDEGIDQASIDEIGDEIKSRSEVKEVQYTSAEDAWKKYQDDYFKDTPEAVEGFSDDNPLAHSASYSVFLNNIEDQSKIVSYIKGLQGVRKVNESQAAEKSLSAINQIIGYVSMTIILILLVVSVFLISNTVAVGISVRKNEISIMKLIGATDVFVRAPFVIEGVIIGLVGAMIPLCILYFVYEKAIVFIVNRFSILAGSLTFLTSEEIFKILLPVGLALGVGIGLVGSIITIRKHLKV